MPSDPVGEHTLRVIAGAANFNHWIYKTIQPYLKENVLEIGSGLGNISQYPVRDGLAITLSDFNPDYCKYLQEAFGSYPNVRAILSIDLQDDGFYLKYAALKETFGSVYLLNVMEHLADDEKAVAFCRFFLKKGGNLIILVPAFSWLYCRLDKNLGHLKRYNVRQLKTLLHTHFTIIHFQYLNALGMAGWLLYGKILRHAALQKGEMQAYDTLVPLAKGIDRFSKRLFGLSLVSIAQKK